MLSTESRHTHLSAITGCVNLILEKNDMLSTQKAQFLFYLSLPRRVSSKDNLDFRRPIKNFRGFLEFQYRVHGHHTSFRVLRLK